MSVSFHRNQRMTNESLRVPICSATNARCLPSVDVEVASRDIQVESQGTIVSRETVIMAAMPSTATIFSLCGAWLRFWTNSSAPIHWMKTW